jgi:hypothetical protein
MSRKRFTEEFKIEGVRQRLLVIANRDVGWAAWGLIAVDVSIM